MKRTITKIFIVLGTIIIGSSAVYATTLPISSGATFETYLSNQEQTTDTTMTLAASAYRDGQNISGYQCFTIDASTPSQEYECGTVSSTTPTTVSNITRGIDYVTGTTSETSQIFAHRRGADVKISDYPILTLLTRIINGSDVLPSVLSYVSSTTSIATTSANLASASWVNNLVNLYISNATSTFLGLNNTWTGTNAFSSTLTANSTTNLNGAVTFGSTISAGGAKITNLGTPIANTDAATKSYADNLSFAGVPVANNTTTGRAFSASSTQIAGGLSGGTTTPYFIPSTLASSTASTSGIVVASGSDGKIDPSFLNGSGESYTFNGTTTFNGNVSGATQFGGTGSDGALNVSSGITTINLGGAQLFTKNYSSISITGTGEIDFINPSSSGSVIYLKSKGNCTITSSATIGIDASSTGASGGASNTHSGSGTFTAFGNGGTGGSTFDYLTTGGGGGTSSVTGGSAGSGVAYAYQSTFWNILLFKFPNIFIGGGGGSGALASVSAGSYNITSGVGGPGGGALIMECAGAWNFGSGATISVNGGNGTNATESSISNGSGAQGGSGGGGGFFLALYNSLIANSGNVTTAGGSGGTSVSGGGSSNGSNCQSGSGGSQTAGSAGLCTVVNGVTAPSGANGTSLGAVLNTVF